MYTGAAEGEAVNEDQCIGRTAYIDLDKNIPKKGEYLWFRPGSNRFVDGVFRCMRLSVDTCAVLKKAAGLPPTGETNLGIESGDVLIDESF